MQEPKPYLGAQNWSGLHRCSTREIYSNLIEVRLLERRCARAMARVFDRSLAHVYMEEAFFQPSGVGGERRVGRVLRQVFGLDA